MVQDNPYLEVWRSLSLDQTELKKSLANDLDWTKFGKMILTPLIDIDNLDTTNGIIYIFEPLWSLMTKGEK